MGIQIKSKQAGISLLEVLLSLSIIAIILVMATRYFFLASNNNRINKTREQIGSVIEAIHGWKGQNPQYGAGLSMVNLYNDGFITKSNDLDTDQSAPKATKANLFDAWGQQITITTNGTQSPTVATTVPTASDCKKLQNSYPTGTCTTGAAGGSTQFSIKVT